MDDSRLNDAKIKLTNHPEDFALLARLVEAHVCRSWWWPHLDVRVKLEWFEYTCRVVKDALRNYGEMYVRLHALQSQPVSQQFGLRN